MICTNMTMTMYDNGSATTVPVTTTPILFSNSRGGTTSFWTEDSGTTAKAINNTIKLWVQAYDASASSKTSCTYTYKPTSSSTCTSYYDCGDWGPFADGVWADCGNWKARYVPTPIKTPKERLKELLQSRHAPIIMGARKPLVIPQDVREIRARETLQRVIGNDKFQRFIKDGFISVRAKSGLHYQIFPAHGITNVYCDGEQIERLCVVLRGDFPPTDSLIMRYLIILNDEARFRSYAIKHTVIVKKPTLITNDERSLTEIFQEMKQARKVA